MRARRVMPPEEARQPRVIGPVQGLERLQIARRDPGDQPGVRRLGRFGGGAGLLNSTAQHRYLWTCVDSSACEKGSCGPKRKAIGVQSASRPPVQASTAFAGRAPRAARLRLVTPSWSTAALQAAFNGHLHSPVAMNPESATPASPTRLTDLPRAVWVGGGLLSLVTAALAGALITKSLQPAAPALPATPVVLAASPAPENKVANPAPNKTAADPARPAKAANRAGPATNASAEAWNAPTTPVVVCSSCGTVESVSAVKLKGQGSGLGAVAGGVLGGVVGHQVGGGNGKTAMTVLGAVGGGFAGNEVERRVRSETAFDLHIRMEDGSRRTIRQPQAIAAGTRVVIEGNRVRVTTDGARPRAITASSSSET